MPGCVLVWAITFQGVRQVDYVLGKWDDKEIPLLQKKVLQSIEIIESFVTIGLDRTMNQFNNKKVQLIDEKKDAEKSSSGESTRTLTTFY